MSEFLNNRDLSLETYSISVAMSRFDDREDPNWKTTSADYLRGEFLEIMGQHGPGMLLMFPDGQPIPLLQDEIEPLIYKMADEMGDSLWFCFDIADKARIHLPGAVMQSIRKVSPGVAEPAATFKDIEAAAIKHASDIKVITKGGLMFRDSLDEDQRYRALRQNPSYLYNRALSRLIKSLHDEPAVIPSATDLEPMAPLPDALGDYLLVSAYVARRSLGVGLEAVAQFNMDKLSHRQKYGKSQDLEFADWFKQPLGFS